MSAERLVLSEKYKAFLRHAAPVEILEGTTAAGKTTVGIFKFMLQVADSKKKYHIVASKDTGTAEKNFINKDLGIVDDFGVLAEYNGNGTKSEKIPHILFHTSSGEKIVYVMGYGDKKKWQKALGGQYGCLYIDEANTADIDFVREAVMRADYTMMTLNPDAPDLPIYKEYINCARALPEYEHDTPQEIREMMCEEAKPGYVYWFFSFEHNAGLPREKIEQIKLNTPKGTKLWKNKIQGLRGRATGLVFCNFNRKHHVISLKQAEAFSGVEMEQEKEQFIIFTSGLDTAYSTKSPDTIAMSFLGITNRGRCIVLDEKVYNNADMDTPIAPSDTVRNYVDFLERNRKKWGMSKNVFVDSADQATLTELAKYKRSHPECLYVFNNAYKQITIVDRIILQLGWMHHEETRNREAQFFVLEHCTNYIRELDTYSWMEDKDETPEDKNDHMVNSVQYAFLPYRNKIGTEERV